MSAKLVRDAQQRFQVTKAAWLQSQSRKRLIGILDNNRPTEGWRIREASAFALGPLAGDSRSFEPFTQQEKELYTRKSMVQLVVFLDIVEFIESTDKVHIKKIAQDPAFSASDRDFLMSLQVSWSKSPQAQKVVNSPLCSLSRLTWDTKPS